MAASSGQYGECMTEDVLFESLSLDCRVDADGTVRYYNALGQRHRVYGPAIERPDGYRAWYLNGQLHRLDGPAVERPDGYRSWWQKGQLHRLDGPAIERPDGGCDWFFNGQHLTQADWQRAVRRMYD